MSGHGSGRGKQERDKAVKHDRDITPALTPEQQAEFDAEQERLRKKIAGGSTDDPPGETRQLRKPLVVGPKADPYAIHHRKGGTLGRGPEF